MKLLFTVSVCVLTFGLASCAEPSGEYLPPTEEVSQEYIPPAVEAEPAAILADDGYRYKAIKRLKFRHRRDVSELNSEYLPPVQEEEVPVEQEIAQAPVPIPEQQPEPAHTLADDGYRYKAIKRYRFRVRRDVSELSNEYLPPTQQEQAVEVVQEAALAPVEEAAPVVLAQPEPEPAHTLADDGYRYKTVKRYRYRHRRDVSELNNEYLPPNQQEHAVEVLQEAAPAPVEEAAPVVVAEPEPAHTLADDGYRYKTVKRYRYRHRRDVSELNNEYLPPNQQEHAVEVLQEAAPAPVEEAATVVVAEPEPAHTLADDGYRYKTVKRYRYRHRRDVSELNNEYLPPNQQEQTVEVLREAAPAPVEEAAPVVVAEPEPAHTLADDGYRYKTVKRYRYRHRRDVSELNNEYLPPNQQEHAVEVLQEAAPAPVEEAAPVVVAEPEPAHTLADDGYRYKTVKRYRYRHRRDVSELNNEYLPPNQQEQAVEVVQEAGPAPVEEAATVVVAEPEPAHTLADDGYRYKTVKRYRYRHRRDVSELNNEYLPPNQQEQAVEVVQEAGPAPVEEAATVVVAEPEPAHTLADDGYRYKTVKRYRYRHRRDVSELNNEYLPPNQQEHAVEVLQEAAPAPVEEAAPVVVAEPEPAHTLADDGYRYKTVKRYRYRHRRDVSELNNEYLPPNQQEQAVEVVQEAGPAPVEEAATVVVAEPEPAHTLADDGYRYKTVKRYRYRHRRDVSELNNEYLPPNQQEHAVEGVQEAAPIPVEEAVSVVVAEPEPAHTLADDGYRYKTVKRYRYRIRRDASEVSNNYLPPHEEVNQEYLPPAQEVSHSEAPLVEAAEVEPAHSLGAEGYKYKTIKRVVYRRKY